MSPESIMYRKYTIESDCWSFGILLWEVLTYGKQPWFEYSNLEVIQNVTRGRQLSQPDNCPPALVELMQACWQFNPTERMPISKAHVRLKQLMEQHRSGQLQLAASSSPTIGRAYEMKEISSAQVGRKKRVPPSKVESTVSPPPPTDTATPESSPEPPSTASNSETTSAEQQQQPRPYLELRH